MCYYKVYDYFFTGKELIDMAKRCTRCGNFLMDDERFCTRCGENVSNVMPEASFNPQDNAFGRNDGYTSPTAPAPAPYTQNYNTYAQPAYRPAEEEMSLGKWVLTIIVTTFFGIISLIFLFVWGFGDGPTSRKNYCKAMLIVELISIGLAILMMFVFMGIFASSMSQILEEIRETYPEYSQSAANMLSVFFH